MTYATIHQSVNDEELISRVVAGASKEAWANETFGDTTTGKALRDNPNTARSIFVWPVAIDNEADYEFAVNNSHPNPGGPDVITDASIQAGVQAHWPADPDPATAPPDPLNGQ